MIRYVHIPDSVDAVRNLQRFVSPPPLPSFQYAPCITLPLLPAALRTRARRAYPKSGRTNTNGTCGKLPQHRAQRREAAQAWQVATAAGHEAGAAACTVRSVIESGAPYTQSATRGAWSLRQPARQRESAPDRCGQPVDMDSPVPAPCACGHAIAAVCRAARSMASKPWGAGVRGRGLGGGGRAEGGRGGRRQAAGGGRTVQEARAAVLGGQ
jgi:hypothetical protein